MFAQYTQFPKPLVCPPANNIYGQFRYCASSFYVNVIACWVVPASIVRYIIINRGSHQLVYGHQQARLEKCEGDRLQRVLSREKGRDRVTEKGEIV